MDPSSEDFIYQKDVVDQHCPKCGRIVPCDRTVYKKDILFTCRPKSHHFTYTLKNGEKVPGVRQVPIDPKKMGLNEEDK